ncbi:MAG: hypothetical protein J5589_09215 [Firmicutes bacterium]|nr:hypothetical protein [Bacillota bacterium]
MMKAKKLVALGIILCLVLNMLSGCTKKQETKPLELKKAEQIPLISPVSFEDLSTTQQKLSLLINWCYWELGASVDEIGLGPESPILRWFDGYPISAFHVQKRGSILDQLIFAWIPNRPEVKDEIENRIKNDVAEQEDYGVRYCQEEGQDPVLTVFCWGPEAEQILSYIDQAEYCVSPFFYYTGESFMIGSDDFGSLTVPAVTMNGIGSIFDDLLQIPDERPNHVSEKIGKGIVQYAYSYEKTTIRLMIRPDGVLYGYIRATSEDSLARQEEKLKSLAEERGLAFRRYEMSGNVFFAAASSKALQEITAVMEAFLEKGSASFEITGYTPAGQSLEELTGLSPDQVDEVVMTYREDDQEVSLRMTKADETTYFPVLIQYLFGSLVRDPRADSFTRDPLAIVLRSSDPAKEQVLTFSSVELADEEESGYYLYLDDQAYRLVPGDIGTVIPHPSMLEAPRRDFLVWLMRLIWDTGVTLKEGEDNQYILPTEYPPSYVPMPFWEEILEWSNAIVVAKVTSQDIMRPDQRKTLTDMDTGTYMQMLEYYSVPMANRNELTIEIQDTLRGEIGKEIIHVPGGILPAVKTGKDLVYGTTEQAIEEGKTYVFFLNTALNTRLLVARPFASDYWFGMMELDGNGILWPMFRMDPDEEGYYTISLDELRKMISD